jgi:hypothetical protein
MQAKEGAEVQGGGPASVQQKVIHNYVGPNREAVVQVLVSLPRALVHVAIEAENGKALQHTQTCQ